MSNTNKYADLILSMTADFRTGKIDEEHYLNMLGHAAKQMGAIPYDSEADTLKHIKRVSELLTDGAIELIKRASKHDNTKMLEPEKSLFDEMTPKLKGTSYGSEEYKGYLKQLSIALKHHYANNSHHPEHYENGINGMDLFDLIEMFYDWKAATERHEDGSIGKSIEINKERFSMSDQVVDVFRNTAKRLGYLS